MSKTYVQAINLRRRVDDTNATKHQLYIEAAELTKTLVLPEGLEVDEIDVYELRRNKDGDEQRHWQD